MSHIWVVSADAQAVTDIAETLATLGHGARCFCSANEFVAQLCCIEECALVILEIYMPDIPIWNVLREIAELENKPPIILMGGSVLDPELTITESIVGTIQKPILAADLENLMGKLQFEMT